jgi:hypothetical protein
MAMPMSAVFQRRCVVDPVAGDGDDLALVLERLDDPHLLLGGDAGEEDLGRIECQLQLCRRHQAQLLAVDDHRRLAHDQADLAGNRQRGARVVAGDHDDPDAGFLAARDRLRYLGARRIFEADQPGEDHPLLVAGYACLVDRPMGKGENAQTGAGHLVLRRQQAGAGSRIERCQAGIELDEAAAGEHRLEGALAVEHAALRRLAESPTCVCGRCRTESRQRG